MITSLPRRPTPLQPAPKAIAPELLQTLLQDRAQLHGYAVNLPARCASLQRAILRGTWFSPADLRRTQRICRTVLIAVRAHRDLPDETLTALDGLQAFCNGIQMTPVEPGPIKGVKDAAYVPPVHTRHPSAPNHCRLERLIGT
jgi:hypothetical protein